MTTTPQEPRQEEYEKRYKEFKEKGHSFWPHVIFEDTFAALCVLVGLIVLTVFWGVPTEGRANPTDTNYIPRPEWYFLFLFQMLKVFPGYLEWVGVLIVPAVAMMLIFLVPFYDRNPYRHWSKRRIAMGALVAGAVFVVGLTVFAIQSTPAQPAAEAGQTNLTSVQLEGLQLYQSNCVACHAIKGSGGTSGPPLDGIASRRSATWLHDWIANPRSISPNATMPAYIPTPETAKLTHPQIEKIVQYLGTLK